MIDHLQSSYTFVVDSRLDSPPSAPSAPVAQVPPAPIAVSHQQQPQLTVPQQVNSRFVYHLVFIDISSIQYYHDYRDFFH